MAPIDRSDATEARAEAAGSQEAPGASLDRELPAERGVVRPDPGRGGAAATPSFGLPADGSTGLPSLPAPIRVGPRELAWGSRTYVMGILNVTPDSFSGDGLLRARGGAVEAGGGLLRSPGGAGEAEDAGGAGAGVAGDPVEDAVALARQMVAEGADLLDVGGESSRPGHAAVPAAEEIARVVPVIRALHAALPAVPLSVDTTKPGVAEAALEAGAHLVNDVWGVAEDDRLAHVAAAHGVPLVVMHNRAEARYTALVAEVVADLQRALERAVRAGVPWERLIVDPGFGFGKAPEHNLAILRELPVLRALGRPILLGTSRKSTLGKVLDLPAGERVEATLATTALGVAAGVDIVRVHDVLPNVRAARMADAVVRGWRPTSWEGPR